MPAYIFDAFLIFGVLIMTLGVVGMWRMPDLYTRLHAASKSVFLGVMVIALSATVITEGAVVARLVLLCILLFITTPVASHVIGRAGYVLHERMTTPGAIDESGQDLADGTIPPWRI